MSPKSGQTGMDVTGEQPNFIVHAGGQILTNASKRTRRRGARHGDDVAHFTALSFGPAASHQEPLFSLASHTSMQGIASHCAAPLPLQPSNPAAVRGRPRATSATPAPFAALSLAWLDGWMFNRGGGLRTAISQSWAQIDVDQSGSLSLADLEGYARQNGLPREYVHQFMSAVLQVHSNQAANQGQPEAKLELSEQQEGTTNGSTSGSGSCQAASVSSSGKPCPPWPLPVPAQPQQAPLLAALSKLLAQPAAKPNSSSDAAQETPQMELTFGMFERFVRSRETALRRAFDLFDKNHDGVISVEDLEASLAHIAICCPKSRCVYRCPRTMAHAMLQRTQAVVQSEGSSVDFASFRRFFMLLPQTELAVEYWLRAGTLPLLTEKLAAVHEGSEPGPKAAAWGHLFAGAVAGAASRTATAPLETLRLAVMTGTLPAGNLVQAASSIVEAQGWQGLYRGNALNVLRSAPQKALDFFAFDAFKRLLAGNPGDKADEGVGAGAIRTFAAAGLAGATSWALLYPLETVRSRITAGMAPTGMSVLNLARHILHKEGVGALYRGLGWSLAGIFPEAALCYGLHDLLKHCYRQSHQGQEPGVMPSLGFGVLSAFTGQLVAFPLETVSRRLQVYQGPGGLPTMLKAMLQQGGPMVLYRGVGAATLRLVPMAIVSFGTYEVVRSALMAIEEGAGAVEAESAYAQVHSYCTPLSETMPKVSTGLPGPAMAAAASAACTSDEGYALRSCSLLPASGISTHRCASLDSRLSLGTRRPPVGAAVMCGAAPSGSTPVGPIVTEPAVSGEGDTGAGVDTQACPGGASLMCAAKQEIKANSQRAAAAVCGAAPGGQQAGVAHGEPGAMPNAAAHPPVATKCVMVGA